MTTSGRLLWLNVELQELHESMSTAHGERFTRTAYAIADKQTEKDDLEAAWFAGRAILKAGRVA